MPDIDKPLPSVQVHPHDGRWPQSTEYSDMVSQILEATHSPSPLLRILHDESILPKSRRDEHQKRAARSPRRGRTEVVAALAIAEEEKQSRQLKSLLRNSGERLEYEIRRADAATLRAEMAERQERTNLARVRSAEAEKDEMRKVCHGLERDLREYQIQLEAAQSELRLLTMDVCEKGREMEALQTGEARAQEDARTSRRGMNELQMEIQNVAHEWYESGRAAGYAAGRKAKRADGIDERRNAPNERIRRWVQSIEVDTCT